MFNSSLIAVLLLCISTTFAAAQNAQTLDLSGMTEEQQSAIQNVYDQMTDSQTDAGSVLNALRTMNITETEFSTWAQAGTEAGRAVSNFTREIGATANEFMESFVGKAIFLIVFMNYGGGKLASFFLDVIIFASLTPIFIYFILRVFRRFVLHQTYDSSKERGQRWIPLRTEDEDQDDALMLDKETPIRFSTLESVMGWVFIVICTMVYLSQMWPTWS